MFAAIVRMGAMTICWLMVRKPRSVGEMRVPTMGLSALEPIVCTAPAAVVTAREDDDALLYLGDDYPFFVRSLETADLEAMILAMVEGFGGPDWRLAQAIMAEVGARSSDRVVAAEFRAMVETITG